MNKRLFFKLRVSFLLTVLVIVAGGALYDRHQRRARNDWERPLLVGLVILQRDDVDPRALRALMARIPTLEARLREEYARYAKSAHEPFEFVTFGPLAIAQLPPSDPGKNFWELALHTYDRFRYLRRIDRALNVPTRGFDSRVYIVAEPAKTDAHFSVDGLSEQNGRVGIARVELDLAMVDLALFVATHELLHTLGATDKYDANGRALVPDGIAEPNRSPRYPQRFAEIMARNRPLNASLETPPETLAELAVGATTAREIGWLR